MDLLLPIQEPVRIIHAIFIMAGLWLDAKLFWMLIYEIKYGRDAGLYYFEFGKKKTIEKFSSTGNIGIKEMYYIVLDFLRAIPPKRS